MTSAVVVVAHGSRAAAANDAHRALAADLAERVPVTVVPAFLELADPDIPAGIAEAVAAGATEVVVLPYFLHPGRHLVEDIPALVDQARAAHPGTTVRLLGAFGADPAVVDALTAQVTAALPEAPSSSGSPATS